MTGSHEVRGSIPLGSTKITKHSQRASRLVAAPQNTLSLPKMGLPSLISEIISGEKEFRRRRGQRNPTQITLAHALSYHVTEYR